MTEFEILTIWISAVHAFISLIVGVGQCALIWYGLRLMQRGTERREEQSQRLHEESKRWHEQNYGRSGCPSPRKHESAGSPD